MKKHTKILAATLVLSFLTLTALAHDEPVRSFRSARSVGMGGLVTTTETYEGALWNGNPAMHTQEDTWKLSILNFTGEINSNLISDRSGFSSVSSATGSDIFTKVADSGIVGHNEHFRFSFTPGYYSPRFLSDNNSLAIGLLVNTQNNIMLRNTVELDVMSITDVGPGVGFARKFMDGDLSIGINARMIYRLGADKAFQATTFLGGNKLSAKDIGGQGAGIDGDVGGYYKIPIELPIVRFSTGASVNNVAQSQYDVMFKHVIKSVNSLPPANERTGNVGLRADFDDLLVMTQNKAAIEFHQIHLGGNKKNMTTWKRLHMGAETRLIKLIMVRAGFNQGYYTAGIGLNLPVLKLEFATYGEELGANAGTLEDRRYVARLAIEI